MDILGYQIDICVAAQDIARDIAKMPHVSRYKIIDHWMEVYGKSDDVDFLMFVLDKLEQEHGIPQL